MQEEQNIMEIYNNITDLFLKYRLSDTLNNYLNGDKDAYDMFLMEAGYTCKITNRKYDNEICNLCSGNLIMSDNNNHLYCEVCSVPQFNLIKEDDNSNVIKRYLYCERRKIEKILINFNFDIKESENKLTAEEKSKIIEYYLMIKRNILTITGRKYIFKMQFLLSRLFTIINRSDLKNYFNITLSKSTFNKYSIQWLKVCESNNFILENMDDIAIIKYDPRKYRKHKKL